jgi:hypothetical protein
MKVVELDSSARSEFFEDAKSVFDILQTVQKRVHVSGLQGLAVVVMLALLALMLGGVAQGQLRTVAAYLHKFLHHRERH